MINYNYNNTLVYVINLDKYKNNYNKQLPYLNELGLKVNRFKGINAIEDEHLNNKYNKYLSKFAINFTPKSIIGCSLSHMMCCKHIYNNYINTDNNIYDYFLIMEDDAYPIYDKKKFYNILNKTVSDINILDKNWDIIQLHSDGIFSTKDTYTCHYLCGSTAAYLISKNGIIKLLKNKVYWHTDCMDHNFIKFNKYRCKNNLFWTDEKNSLNRNNISYIKHKSLIIKSEMLNIFNNYTNILELRGEKSLKNYLQFKILKLPYINYEYTFTEIIDYSILCYIIYKLNKYKYIKI